MLRRITEYSEDELKVLATRLSKKARTRETYTWVALTGGSQNTVFNIAYGALLSLKWFNGSPEAINFILNYAEYMFIINFPEFNGYDSLFAPLFITIHKEDGAICVDEDKLYERYGV